MKAASGSALILVTLASAGALTIGPTSARAEKLVAAATEARTYIYLKADPAAVQKLLPAGWTSNPGTGATKDANVALVFIQGFAGDNAEGKAVPGQGKFVVLLAGAKNTAAGTEGSMILGGFAAQPAGAPGAYGVYAPANFTMAKAENSEGGGPAAAEETWDVVSEGGDRVHFVVGYERGLGVRAHVEPRIYSSAKPEFYRIYKADLVADIVHAPSADRKAKRLDFAASGPLWSKLGSAPEVVAVTSMPAYYRQIFLPN